jgi:hypothetical protein
VYHNDAVSLRPKPGAEAGFARWPYPAAGSDHHKRPRLQGIADRLAWIATQVYLNAGVDAALLKNQSISILQDRADNRWAIKGQRIGHNFRNDHLDSSLQIARKTGRSP